MPAPESSTFERIQSATSSSTQATAFAEIRQCLGNAPLCSKRQIVERDRPVLSRTDGNRRSFSAVLSRVAGKVECIRLGRTSGAKAAVPTVAPGSRPELALTGPVDFVGSRFIAFPFSESPCRHPAWAGTLAPAATSGLAAADYRAMICCRVRSSPRSSLVFAADAGS